MANGLSAATANFDLVAATDTDIYTAPAGKSPSVNVYLCNHGTATALVRISRTTGGAPALKDRLVSDAPLMPGSPLILSGLRLSEDGKIYVWSNVGTVSAQIDGVEG